MKADTSEVDNGRRRSKGSNSLRLPTNPPNHQSRGSQDDSGGNSLDQPSSTAGASFYVGDTESRGSHQAQLMRRSHSDSPSHRPSSGGSQADSGIVSSSPASNSSESNPWQTVDRSRPAGQRSPGTPGTSNNYRRGRGRGGYAQGRRY